MPHSPDVNTSHDMWCTDGKMRGLRNAIFAPTSVPPQTSGRGTKIACTCA